MLGCRTILTSKRAGRVACTLPRHNTETHIPRKELRSLFPNFHIHESVRDLYIPTIGLPILLQENLWTDPGDKIAQRHMNA
jgi:hypothetical protein